MRHSSCYLLFAGDHVFAVTTDPAIARKYKKIGGRAEKRDLIYQNNYIRCPWLKDVKYEQ